MGSCLQTIENNSLKQKRHFGKSFRYQIAWIHRLQNPASLGPQGGKAQPRWTHTLVCTPPPHQPATATASSTTTGPPTPPWAPPPLDASDVLWTLRGTIAARKTALPWPLCITVLRFETQGQELIQVIRTWLSFRRWGERPPEYLALKSSDGGSHRCLVVGEVTDNISTASLKRWHSKHYLYH